MCLTKNQIILQGLQSIVLWLQSTVQKFQWLLKRFLLLRTHWVQQKIDSTQCQLRENLSKLRTRWWKISIIILVKPLSVSPKKFQEKEFGQQISKEGLELLTQILKSSVRSNWFDPNLRQNLLATQSQRLWKRLLKMQLLLRLISTNTQMVIKLLIF